MSDRFTVETGKGKEEDELPKDAAAEEFRKFGEGRREKLYYCRMNLINSKYFCSQPIIITKLVTKSVIFFTLCLKCACNVQ